MISLLHDRIRQRLQVILLAAGSMNDLAQKCGADTTMDYDGIQRAVRSIDQLLLATPSPPRPDSQIVAAYNAMPAPHPYAMEPSTSCDVHRRSHL